MTTSNNNPQAIIKLNGKFDQVVFGHEQIEWWKSVAKYSQEARKLYDLLPWSMQLSEKMPEVYTVEIQ